MCLASCVLRPASCSLALGLVILLAASMLIANVLMAVTTVRRRNGFWNANRGFEFPLTLVGGLIAIGLARPGAFALGLNTFAGLSPLVLFSATLALGLIGVLMASYIGLRHSERRMVG